MTFCLCSSIRSSCCIFNYLWGEGEWQRKKVKTKRSKKQQLCFVLFSMCLVFEDDSLALRLRLIYWTILIHEPKEWDFKYNSWLIWCSCYKINHWIWNFIYLIWSIYLLMDNLAYEAIARRDHHGIIFVLGGRCLKL